MSCTTRKAMDTAGGRSLRRRIRSLRVAAWAAALLLVPAPGDGQAPPEHEEVKAAVQRLFDAMRTRDTLAIRGVMLPDARLVNPIRSGQTRTVRVLSVEQLIEMVVRTPEPYDERMHGWEVRVDQDLATVWGRYTFRVGQRLTNCGSNAVQLLRTSAGWRITQVASTLITSGCDASLPPAEPPPAPNGTAGAG